MKSQVSKTRRGERIEVDELIDAVIYDQPGRFGRKQPREVKLLRIPDTHRVIDADDMVVTMGEVLEVGLSPGTPTGEAYVVLSPGDRRWDD